MKPTQLEIGDVVQISPEQKDSFFCGCFMVVTEPKSWGAQGYVSVPGQRGTVPGAAFTRVNWDEMEYVGKAAWTQVVDGHGVHSRSET